MRFGDGTMRDGVDGRVPVTGRGLVDARKRGVGRGKVPMVDRAGCGLEAARNVAWVAG